MRRPQRLWMALPAALMILGPACSDDPSNGGDNGTANGAADAGAPDAAPADAGETVVDAGPEDAGGPFACRFDQECDEGEVCNLITRACEPGRACAGDSDCDVCSEVPIESSEYCGHGLRLTAYCDPERSVCTRSRASCEPCETDADCGRIRFGNFLQTQNYCIDYAEVEGGRALSGKFCARAASASAGVRGFELQPLGPGGQNVYVNPNGCPADPEELFFCPFIDEDEDGRAETNTECDDYESACIDDPCPGTGGQRCANINLPGVPPICGDYCLSNADCADQGSRNFCNPNTGVCQSGCSPGACPNNQVCHFGGDCGPPCSEIPNPDEDELRDADQFCIDEGYGENTYCNVQSPNRPLPKLSKRYRDFGACAPLGCERGQDEQINRDCGGQEVCDITTVNQDGLPEPACVPGCFSADDCTVVEPCNSDAECTAERPWCQPNPDPMTPGNCSVFPLQNPDVFRCVDAPSGQVSGNRQACRDEFFSNGLDEDNRDSENPRIGTCCETGCLSRSNDCVGSAAFCCEEEGSPYEDPASCGVVVQDDPNPIQAQPGTCFEAPVQPFCQPCSGPTQDDPLAGFNTCNSAAVEGLVDNPRIGYDLATVWPTGENQDCEGCSDPELDDYTAVGGQVNGGTPFFEVQRCVNAAPPMAPPFPICTVAYDPQKVADAGSALAAGVPRGWQCAGRAPPCVDDSQCNGLTCAGVQMTPDGVIPGNCQCGEDGVPTVACPDTIEGVPMLSNTVTAPTRMRCVEARTRNFQGPASPDVSAGDMFCVYTFDCTPPTLQVPDFTEPEERRAIPQTLPDACGFPAVYDDPTE